MKKIVVWALLFFSIFLRVPCQDSTIVYLRSVETSTLDPGKSNEKYSSEVIANMFEGLVRFRKDSLDIEPCLAERWESLENGQRWTFHLRRGVLFHDRTPFNARSVVYSFRERMARQDSEYKKWNLLFSPVTAVRAVDDHTVEIALSRPYAPFLTYLMDVAAFIVPENAYEKKKFVPVGTGPFKFSSWEKDKNLVVSANPDYWGSRPQISKVVFTTVNDSAWRLLQIKNRNADVVVVQSEREFEELLGRREIQILTSHSLKTYFLAFNIRRPPFDRWEVRQAFSHLLDKKILVKQIFGQMAIPAVTLVPPQLFGFNPHIKDPEFNIDTARQLLQRAGLGRGFSCNLYFSEGSVALEEIVNRLTLNARRVLVTVKKVPLPFNKMRGLADRGEHDMLIIGWVGNPDPDFFLYPLLTMERGHSNRSFYDNPSLTALLNQARENVDRGQREQLYFEAQEIIFKDAPCIPLFHLNDMVAVSPDLKNLYTNPYNFLIFKDVSKKSF